MTVPRPRSKVLTRMLHEAFTCEQGKHGIFGSIVEIRTQTYFSAIWPQTPRINLALQARIFRTSTTLATKSRATCGLKRQGVGPEAVVITRLFLNLPALFMKCSGQSLPG